MKKTGKLFLAAVVAAVLSAGSAMAGPVHHGGHHTPNRHQVVHVQPIKRQAHPPRPNHAPRPRPHHRVHHHHHHHNDWVLATAILISALM